MVNKVIQKRYGLKSVGTARKRRRKRAVINVVFGVFVLIFLLSLTSWLSFRDMFSITNVEIIGLSESESVIVKDYVEQKLAGTHYFLISKSNFLLYPKADIKESLLSGFLSFISVDVGTRNLNTLEVEVLLREPTSLWCIELDGEIEKCYYMDSNGYIYKEARDDDVTSFVKYFGEISSQVAIGSVYPQSGNFKDLNGFVSQFASSNVGILKVSMIGGNDFEAEIRSGGKIQFNLKDVKVTLDNVATVLSDKSVYNAGFFEKLDYLDLRHANKVFYKLKDL